MGRLSRVAEPGPGRASPGRTSDDCGRRSRPGEGQSVSACHRAAPRRLPPARQPGGLRRYRRPGRGVAGGYSVPGGRRSGGSGARRSRRRQSRAARRPALYRGRQRRRRSGAVSRQAPADGIGDRRRIERRGGDAAPARLPVGRHRRPGGVGGAGGAARRRRAGLPRGAAGLGRRRRRSAGARRWCARGRHRSGQPSDRAAHSCGVSRAQREVFGAGAVCRDAARRRRARHGTGGPPQRSDRGGADAASPKSPTFSVGWRGCRERCSPA